PSNPPDALTSTFAVCGTIPAVSLPALCLLQCAADQPTEIASWISPCNRARLQTLQTALKSSLDCRPRPQGSPVPSSNIVAAHSPRSALQSSAIPSAS